VALPCPDAIPPPPPAPLPNRPPPAGLQQRLVAALREYRMLHMRGAPGMGGGLSPNSLVLPERLKSLPLLTLGLLKAAALRGSGRDVNSDERAAVGHQLAVCSVYDALRLVYPACYPVHELSGGWEPSPPRRHAFCSCSDACREAQGRRGRHRRRAEAARRLPCLGLRASSASPPLCELRTAPHAPATGAGNWGKERADGGGVELPPTAPPGLEYFNPGGWGMQGLRSWCPKLCAVHAGALSTAPPDSLATRQVTPPPFPPCSRRIPCGQRAHSGDVAGPGLPAQLLLPGVWRAEPAAGRLRWGPLNMGRCTTCGTMPLLPLSHCPSRAQPTPGQLISPPPPTHTHIHTGLNPEPVRPGSELSARINGVLRQLRARRELWQECWVLRQGTPMEAHLMPLLVEDRQAAAGSQGYLDFMLTLQKVGVSVRGRAAGPAVSLPLRRSSLRCLIWIAASPSARPWCCTVPATPPSPPPAPPAIQMLMAK
jgi:hypothetical protein